MEHAPAVRSSPGLVLVALVAAALGPSACATPPHATGGEPSAADYAPLGVGHAWTYSVVYPGQKGEMTVKIVGQKNGYFVDDRDPPSNLRITPEGLRDPQRYLIRNPLQAGSTWKAVVSASAVEHYKVVSVGEVCSTLAGRFDDCLVVESYLRGDKATTLHVRWTWARGIGLVKLETEAEVAGRGRIPAVKQDLVRYALGDGRSGGKASAVPPSAADGPQRRPRASTQQDEPPEAPGWER